MGANTEKKYRRFAEEYVKDITKPRQAAISAGYSAKTASQAASRLLNNVKVKKLIKELEAEAIATAKPHAIATAQEVLAFFTDVMNGKATDYKGRPALMRERLRAAELMARNYGLLTDKVEVNGNVDISAVIARARKRAESDERAE